MSAAPAAARGADGAASAPQVPVRSADPILVPEVFALVSDLGHALGVRDLKSRQGLWKHRIDDRWVVFVNPHREPIRCQGASVGFPLPALTMYFEFNGRPIGLFSSREGMLVADFAAEARLIEALKVAILRVRGAAAR